MIEDIDVALKSERISVRRYRPTGKGEPPFPLLRVPYPDALHALTRYRSPAFGGSTRKSGLSIHDALAAFPLLADKLLRSNRR